MKKPTTYLLFLLPVIVFAACTHPATSTVSLLSYIDTRVGTAASVTKTAGMFGKHTEETPNRSASPLITIGILCFRDSEIRIGSVEVVHKTTVQ